MYRNKKTFCHKSTEKHYAINPCIHHHHKISFLGNKVTLRCQWYLLTYYLKCFLLGILVYKTINDMPSLAGIVHKQETTTENDRWHAK